MSKRLIDIDDDALDAARVQLGTPTIRATVNEALRLAGGQREEDVDRALDSLARLRPADRSQAWR